jgi:putative membrane protein
MAHAVFHLEKNNARANGDLTGTLIRPLRHVIGHLAITGGMAVGDSLVQQMLGHGIAAKLSQRLGEGVVNGLLTARLGLAAIDVTRPLPFTALPRHQLIGCDDAESVSSVNRETGNRIQPH